MKLSRKVIRIKRKYLSFIAVALFIGLGMTVTYVLNTQLTKQQQTIQSRACSSSDCLDQQRNNPQQFPEGSCGKRGFDCCYPANQEGLQGDGICHDGSQCTFNSDNSEWCRGVNLPVDSNCDLGSECASGMCSPDSHTCIEPSGDSPSCSGECANVNNYSCSSGFEKELCPGTPNNIQCCSGELSEKVYSPNEDSGDELPVGGQDPDSDDPAPIKKPPPPPPGADDPKGVVDQNDGRMIKGWAFDPNDTDASLEIHVYIYPEGGSTEGHNLGATTIDRTDVNDTYGIHGYHGFEWNIPGKCDGKSYTADVFAINVGNGGTTTLGGSTWTCSDGGGQNPDPNSGQKPNGLSERDALIKKNFDGRWYLSEYIDVRKDKGYGKNSDSAFQHYLVHGMSEKRNPSPNFDEKYYLDKNPDVAAVVPQDALRSGFEHYLMHGQKPPECRKPKSDLNAPAPCGVKTDGEIQSNSSADIALSLEGIGQGANIKNPVRPADIKLVSNGKTVHNASDFLTYDKTSGNFINHNFNLGPVAPGSYKLIVQMDGYLDKEILGPDGNNQVAVGEGQVVKTAPSQMTAGDNSPLSGGDNKIDVIDYNALIGCMQGSPASACPNRRLSDLNDDGVVDQKDLNIIKNNMGDEGFLLQQADYKCEANPACESGKKSLQMCALLCTKKSERI